ncbi:hypothetical protein BGX31_005008 [Mortierella sp. GBA43]|nr:hypothetical protein BGX31_005008 [Mortierella sp. GBA43]
MNEAHLQAFRTSTSKTITIPTRHDPKSGQRVVRWVDIQRCFKNAQCILNGEDAVLFLTDENLEEIAHHPGVVLEVLVADNSQGFSSAIEILGDVSISSDMGSVRITEITDDQQALVVRPLFNSHQSIPPAQDFSETSNTLDIQRRVQGFLDNFSKDLQVPWLFIILPNNLGFDGQGQPRSGLFRLYFLCEFGFQAVTQDAKRTLQVHMTNHAGYDLKNPEEFLDKYGPYILTSLYMIKHGAVSQKFTVPPLTQSKLVSWIKESQEHLCFIKKNITGLVDATITFLEDITQAMDKDTDTTPHWNLGPAVLGELKSYLELDDGGQFPGDLRPLVAQGRHQWVCDDRQCGWAVDRLKNVVSVIGGAYYENLRRIDIKVGPGGATRQLYDAIIEICRIQHLDNKPSLNVDCGRLLLTTNVSANEEHVAMTIKRVDTLTMDDIEFIYQCNPVELRITSTPQPADENRLVNILQHTPELQELWIGCVGQRSIAVTNAVLSVREKILQDGGTLRLHTLKLMEEELKPFDPRMSWNASEHITITVTFPEHCDKPVMDTRIVMAQQDQSWTYEFLRWCGWSITFMNTASAFSDQHAIALDNTTLIHGSRLRHIILCHYSLSSTGLDAMDRIIRRSRNLDNLCLHLGWLDSQVAKAARLLGRYGARARRVILMGDRIEVWLPSLTKPSSTRHSFPMLEELVLGCSQPTTFPRQYAQWLASMVAAQPPLPSTEDSCEGANLQTEEPSTPTPLTRLTRFQLSGFNLAALDWEILIKAIDFGRLEWLNVSRTNFAQVQMDLLLEHIAETDALLLPLEGLDLTSTSLTGANQPTGATQVTTADRQTLRTRIYEVAPRVTIRGL